MTILEDIVSENFPEEKHDLIFRLRSTPSLKQKINKSKPTLRHIIMKLQNINNKDNPKSGKKKEIIQKGTGSSLPDRTNRHQEMTS